LVETWTLSESNRRPSVCQTDALPAELRARSGCISRIHAVPVLRLHPAARGCPTRQPGLSVIVRRWCGPAGRARGRSRADGRVITLLPWRLGESNPGPSACKADALPIELSPHFQHQAGVPSNVERRDSNADPAISRPRSFWSRWRRNTDDRRRCVPRCLAVLLASSLTPRHHARHGLKPRLCRLPPAPFDAAREMRTVEPRGGDTWI
jgi:hypothetical protein